jgi:type II secretory pathway predicted ATPase ExeA
MSAAECEQYVKFRLLVAGRIADLFDPAAFAALHAGSGGISRNLSKLCMLTLLQGAMTGKTKIDEETVSGAVSMM